MASVHFIKRVIFESGLLLALSAFTLANAAPKNIKPVAIAGSSQSVFVDSVITLNGSQSTDTDGSITKWRWTQIKGSKVKLTNANQAIATFTPTLKASKPSTLLAFKLTVTDNKKASASAKTEVTVKPIPVCKKPLILQNNICSNPPPDCVPPQTLKDGVCLEHKVVCLSTQVFINGLCVNLQPACKAPTILKGGNCITPEFFCDLPLVLKNNACVIAGPLGHFNDTGITNCSDGGANVSGCGITQFPRQDAEFGRDVSHYNDSDGHAGFNFTKISATGAELPLDANEWSCVKDNITGLVWEVKTNDDGLHDKDLTYSLYSPEFNPKNEFATSTDASGFITQVNNQHFCGKTDWRIPTTNELQSIVDYSIPLPGPSIDQNFFPNTRINAFWTHSLNPRYPNKTWLVYFEDGRIFDDSRDRDDGGYIRVVSGTSSSPAYSISNDGQEVTDSMTGLIWQRCADGMQWNGFSCVGTANGFMFQEALLRANLVKNTSGKNWRLPNMKELASLIDTSSNNEIYIDETVFPGSPFGQYWSSSSYSTDAFFAWIVHLAYGSTYYTYTEDTGFVRLVRDKD
ncbi:MAG: DUF1566 domain-containing protein [Methylococcales bacterium]|nr:DUF1566 domain-containing protein [Methylococcaceae bacterium]